MLTVLLPENGHSAGLRQLLTPLLPAGSVFRDPDAGLEALTDQRLLFAVALDEGGCNEAYYRMLSRLRRSLTLLRGSVAGLVVTGVGELYTKDVARDMVFAANQSGCAFIGRPLVEATGSLRNFRTQAQIGGTDEVTAFHAAVAELIDRLASWEKPAPIRHILALHASQRSTSNTLALWELVKSGLPDTAAVEEICLRNGTMADCNGCSYTACLHFGEQGGCFYGGPRRPAVRRAGDAVRQLQRRAGGQPDGLRQPADGVVPPEPVLRQAAVRTGGVRLLRRRSAGAAADLGAEHEQVLLPAAPLLPAGDGQRAGQPCEAAPHRGGGGPVRGEHDGKLNGKHSKGGICKMHIPPFRLSKKPAAFPDSLKNAVIFVPHSGTKICALRSARLARQGLARHSV